MTDTITREIDELKEWCRIRETEHGPVLFYWENDVSGPEDEYKLHQMFRFNGMQADICLSGWEEQITQEQFDAATTQEKADALVMGMMKFTETA